MEKWIFDEVKEDTVYPSDFVPNLGIRGLDIKNCWHMAYIGRTRSGKSNMICKTLMYELMHRIPFKNIVIFSPSFQTDASYLPVRYKLKDLYKKNKIPEKEMKIRSYIDIDIMNEIMKKQMEIKNKNEQYDYNKSRG